MGSDDKATYPRLGRTRSTFKAQASSLAEAVGLLRDTSLLIDYGKSSSQRPLKGSCEGQVKGLMFRWGSLETGETEEQVGTLRSRWELYRTNRGPLNRWGKSEVQLGLLRGK